MDILHVRYFVEVARQGSFTKAAQSLHVSQPSISKLILTLEHELGVTLLERSGKRVILTDAGQAIFPRAQQLVFDFENLSNELADIVGVKKGTVVMGLPPMIGAKFFPKVIGLFKQEYPAITINLVEVGSKQIETGIEDGTLDIGVVALPLDDDSTIETYLIQQEHLRVVLSCDHPLADKTALQLAELQEEPFVFYSDSFSLHNLIIRICRDVGFTPKIICQSSHWDFIAEMAATNLGIALLPESICKSLDASRLRSIPLLKPTVPWNLALVWKKNKYMSFAARAWLSFAKEYFEGNK